MAKKTKRQQFIDSLKRENPKRREKSRQSFLANADVIDGWEWVASKSLRTCGFCLAMDGEVFPLSVPFDGVCRCESEYCRCTLIAVMDDVPRPPRQLGRQWFAGLAENVQEDLLGQERFDEYQQGISLLQIYGG